MRTPCCLVLISILVAAGSAAGNELGARERGERELGTMPFDGQVSLDWTARDTGNDTGSDAGDDGGIVGHYVARGHTENADGEALLAGFDMTCIGMLHVVETTLLSDRAICTLSDGQGNRMRLSLDALRGAWQRHMMSAHFEGGTGPYARVVGEGALVRSMHLAPWAAGPWGLLNGSVRWHLKHQDWQSARQP